jgi:uncharacterized protein (TIGR00297 family)
MNTLFIPSRRNGFIFHGVLFALLGGGGGLSFWAALHQEIGSDLLFYLILSVLLLAPVPLVVYRLVSLQRASYTLERDGLRIRWGLRAEDIPLPQIEWVRPASDLGFALRLPITATPGAFLGNVTVEGLGPVEFIASEVRTMLLVATPSKVYVISPADPKAFLRSFRRVIELGSLSPLSSFSARPVAILERVWADRPARILLLGGFGLSLALFFLVSIRIPAMARVSLGFDAARQPMEPGPAESLLLLPVLGGFAYVVDLLSGLFFYRIESRRPLAYLLWSAGVVIALLLLLGALVFSLGGLEWAILLVAFFGASSGLTRFSASWLSAGSPKSGPPVPKIGIPKIGMRSAMRIAMRSAKVRGHREAQPDCRTQAQRNQDLSASFSKGGQRDAGQVLANGGLAGLFVVAHAVWPDQNWPWAAFAGTLAAVNADTWATELGVLSSALPRIITTFQPVERGISGGVTLAGTLAAAGGGLWIAILSVLFWPGQAVLPLAGGLNLPAPWTSTASFLLAITLAGLIGSLVDSLLGATLQAIYFCPNCALETERYPIHTCGAATSRVRGLAWLGNDGVNAACAVTGSIIGAAWLFV